jgi:hypothetical protein
MDLATLKPTTRHIEIKHPATGEPLGIRVTIVSMDDDRLSGIKREIMDRRLHLESRNKRFKAEEIETNTVRLLFAATLEWEWYNPTGNEGDEGYKADAMPVFNGEQPAFNERNFKAIVKELPWFRDQINEELGETKAFFGNSESS